MKSSQANKIKSTKSCAHKVFWHVFLYLISIVTEGTRTKLPILFSSDKVIDLAYFTSGPISKNYDSPN